MNAVAMGGPEYTSRGVVSVWRTRGDEIVSIRMVRMWRVKG